MDTVVDRFWPRVYKRLDGCWEWIGTRNNLGYGRISLGHRREMYAHRFSYELHKGSIPAGLELDHLCRVPSCVNPAHLEAVTHGENLRRGSKRNGWQTHCPQGHPYSGRNLVLSRRGNGAQFRMCRTCNNTRSLARYHKKRTLELAG